MESDATGHLQSLQPSDSGEDFHAVVGRQAEAAMQFLPNIAVYQDGSIASSPRIGFAGTVRVDRYLA